MSRVRQLALQVYARLLRLYPRRFYQTFAAEMEEIFALAVADAAQGGRSAVVRLLMGELADLPVNLIVEHVYERRKGLMQLLRYDTEREVQWIRWLARGLSLLFSGFILSLFLFNEDVRQSPTPPTIVLALLSVSMLLAWRWEELGGKLTMMGAPLCLVAVMYMTTQVESILWLALVVGLALTLVPLIVGWLFVSVARHTPVTRGVAGNGERPRRWRILALLVVVLVVIALLVLSLVGAPFREVRRMEGGVTPGAEVGRGEGAGTHLNAEAMGQRSRLAVVNITSSTARSGDTL
jgi:MFS family permease